MNIEQIKSMATDCYEILRLHFSDPMEDDPYYRYGMSFVIDSFVDFMNPFVIGIHGIDLTDGCVEIQHVIQCDDSLILSCNLRGGKNVQLRFPYAVLEKGIDSIAGYNKEVEYQTLVSEMLVLVNRIRNDSAQMEILGKRIEQLVKV